VGLGDVLDVDEVVAMFVHEAEGTFNELPLFWRERWLGGDGFAPEEKNHHFLDNGATLNFGEGE
jgi:hypothetical protein